MCIFILLKRNIHQSQQLTATDTIQRVMQNVQQELFRVCKNDIILLELSVKKIPHGGDFFLHLYVFTFFNRCRWRTT